MNAEHATPELIDALAGIEMQRQEREKESGVPVSCNWALGKLYELLPREKKSPGMNAESAALQGNIEAATLAIGRLRKLAQTTSQRATPKSDRPWHRRSDSSSSSSP
ncbi:MAG: hypothetical protein E6H45_15760 [Betaproteobacteria bacterium]|nr:MAG: hypothetical protein E6H45_15760 [Betaproteobacteria bacterium]